jgi:hypothetical protein
MTEKPLTFTMTPRQYAYVMTLLDEHGSDTAAALADELFLQYQNQTGDEHDRRACDTHKWVRDEYNIEVCSRCGEGR